MASGRQLRLADLTKPGRSAGGDPTAGRSRIIRDRAQPGSAATRPGDATRSVSTGGLPTRSSPADYKAWALTPDELILYMPDYPVAHDSPIQLRPAHAVVDERRHRPGAHPTRGAQPDPAPGVRRGLNRRNVVPAIVFDEPLDADDGVGAVGAQGQ